MKRAAVIAFLLSACLCAQAQERNWRMTPLPIISYRSDLGLQVGAVAELYDTLTNRIHVDVAYFTKGQTMADARYDSYSLIPGVHVNAGVRFRVDPYYNFYGFGGDATAYDPAADRRNGKAYYSYSSKTMQAFCTFDGGFTSRLGWTAGISYRLFRNGDIGGSDYDPANTLYHFYRSTGVIRDDETAGSLLELKAGLNYDSRNSYHYPTCGTRADIALVGAPGIGGNRYLKLLAQLREFVSPGVDWLTFALNIAYQGTIAGETPFYVQEHIYSRQPDEPVTRGLGGENTIRGLLTGRLLGDGYAWSNIEARFKILKWDLEGTEWFLGLNPFFDMGLITRTSRLEEISAATGEKLDVLRDRATRFHKSAGIGLMFGLGGSNIVSVEYARTLGEGDAPGSILVGTGFIF